MNFRTTKSAYLSGKTVGYRFTMAKGLCYVWVQPGRILVDYANVQYMLDPRPMRPGLDTAEWVEQCLSTGNYKILNSNEQGLVV